MSKASSPLRAIVRAFGPAAEVVAVESYEPGRPMPGQVRVRMTARSINPSDLVTISGAYASRTARPFVPGFEGTRWRLGKWHAWMAFERARRSTPAYREFLAEHDDPRVRVRGLEPDLTTIPVTDKDNYVLRWPVEAR